MSNRLDLFKKTYNEIDIPDQLAAVADAAIQRGKIERKRTKQANSIRWVKRVVVGAAALFILFTISINTMPAFASSLEKIPGLEQLVRTLQFNKGSAGGGTITDSTAINVISLEKKGDLEHIVIHFQQNNKDQQMTNSFTVNYSQYPNTMTFSIGGVRRFSAEKDLAELKKSSLIAEAYPLISPDDSLVRFNITFKSNVSYEVKEYKEPAQVVLTIKRDSAETNPPTIYSLRTASSAFGETQGIYEEMLRGLEGVRTLKDQQGGYFVEAGYYSSEEAAMGKMQEIVKTYGISDHSLYIEQREAMQYPQAINARSDNQ